MAHVVTQNCCNDATCVEVCPVDCIHPAPGEPGYATAEILFIDADSCIDCGACVDECPVGAIVPDEELDSGGDRYLALSEQFYAANDSESGAGAKSGVDVGRRRDDAPDLRVAVVGSGPSACYAAEQLLNRRDVRAEVTMIERLPFAGGLVRYGVAPDHSRTKEIDRVFDRTLHRDRLSLYLDVEVGRDVSVEELLDTHHAVLLATGASSDRMLNVAGEDLDGVAGAREFVAWYNGHPDHVDARFDLSGERAVVVGNGNVALDVARILVSDVEALRRTDMADHALDAFAQSAVREVVVLGRRGPEHAACTTPELFGLVDLDGVDVVAEGIGPVDPDASLKTRLFADLTSTTVTEGNRRITFRFGVSPEQLLGADGAVTGMRLRTADGGTEDLECGLVLRSIGYRGSPFPGVPFDEGRGTLANAGGRITDGVGGEVLTGLYTAGWLKRGPSGVIGTNRQCAAETVAALVADHTDGRTGVPTGGATELETLLGVRRPQYMTATDWFEIDRRERREGRAQRRPRVKRWHRDLESLT